MYEHIIFDLDNTLISFNHSEAAGLSIIYDELAPDMSRTDFNTLYHNVNKPLWHFVETHQLTPRQVADLRMKKLVATLQLSADPQHIASLFEEALGSTIQWEPGAQACLSACSCSIVTNGLTRVQRLKEKHANFSQHITHYIISEEARVAKPNPAIFTPIFKDFSPETCLMVGDSLSSDGRGAQNANIDFCWYNPTKQKNETNVPVKFEIATLSSDYFR